MPKDFLIGFCLGCARTQLILYVIVCVPILFTRGALPPIAYLTIAALLLALFALTCVWAFFRYRRVSKQRGEPPGWNLLSDYQRGLAASLIGMALR